MIKRLSILIFIAPFFGYSQTIVSASVLDEETHKPLELVTVVALRTNIGTVTNAEGLFKLVLNNLKPTDSLRFSMIGYEPLMVQTSSLPDLVKLRQKNYSLNEITISAKKITAEEIVKRAIDNRKKNYDYSPFKLEAYYRELGNANGKYNHLIEVALNTYGKDIDHYHQSVELVNSRKIDFAKLPYGENLLNSTLRLDYIASTEHFDFSNFKKNQYEIESVQAFDSKYVYVITSGKYPKRNWKFFIDEETSAIVRAEMDLSFNAGKNPEVGPLDKTHQLRLYHIKVINIYRVYEEKYYPDYIHVLWEFDKFNIQSKKVVEKGSLFREFKVSHIVTDNKSKPDPSKLMIKFGSRIDQQISEYKSEFWKTYNVVPLTSQAVIDLSQSETLEKQFIKNGKKKK